MNRRIFRIAAALAFAGLIWAFLYLKALDPLKALRAQNRADSTHALSIRFKDAKLIGWSGGKRIWRFNANQIDVDKNRTQAIFEGGINGVMLKDDQKMGRIKADKVIYNIFSNDLIVPETAEIKLEKGPAVKASKIYWNPHTSRLVCEGGADAILDMGTVHGEKLFLDFAKKEVTMNKVSGTIKVDE